MRLTNPLLAALAVTASLLAACGKQTLVAGLFFQTPQLPNPNAPPELNCSNGLNPKLCLLGPYALLTGFVSTIDISDPTKIQDAKVEGVTQVQAQIVYRSCAGQANPVTCAATGADGVDRVFAVPESGGGLYTLNNLNPPEGQPAITFEEGVQYTLVLKVPTGGTDSAGKPLDFEAYGARFRPGPAPKIVEFKNKAAVKHVALGEPMTITREDAPVNGELLPAFAVVGQIDPQNPTALPTITYTSLNYQDPKQLVLLVLSDRPYRKSSYDIPGSAFASPGTYIVSLVTISEGKASANAFLGSTALAGSGDAGLVQVP